VTSFAETIEQRFMARYTLGFTYLQRTALTLLLLGPLGLVLNSPRVHAAMQGRRGMLFGLASAAYAYLAFVLPDRLARRARVRWIDRLTLPLDRASYAAALSGRTRRAALEVVVEGADLSRPELGGVGGTVQATAGGLRFESPVFAVGTVDMWPGAVHNLPLHRWFHRLAEQVLVPLGEGRRIDRVAVRHLDAGPA
jgi:hypothetical protein